ncbi:RHS repeat domain-containing protein [Microcoleus sp. C2C3]|uniref:RHS repeat domain-containing protein n=1 Tax=unclassified Microcoleus TaxID=2642155 RepID=UPI002FD15ED0
MNDGVTTESKAPPVADLVEVIGEQNIEDAEGKITKFEYDIRGNLLKLVDANNKVTEFRYDAFGNVNWLKDAKGNITEYKYDPNGNRTEETRKNVTTPSGLQDIVTK